MSKNEEAVTKSEVAARSFAANITTGAGGMKEIEPQRFATRHEAKSYAEDYQMRDPAITEIGTEQTEDDVTHHWDPEKGLKKGPAK